MAITSMRLSTPAAADALGAEDRVGVGVDEQLQAPSVSAPG